MLHRRASVAWSGTTGFDSLSAKSKSVRGLTDTEKIERFFHLKKIYYTMSVCMAVEMLSSFCSF